MADSANGTGHVPVPPPLPGASAALPAEPGSNAPDAAPAAVSPSGTPAGRPARARKGITVREMCVFAMLGTIMYLSKMLMEWAPNIHFLAMLTVTYTLVYRKKALLPVFVFIMLTGIYAGFHTWWYPYLYLWPILWGAAMLLPRSLEHKKWGGAVYMAVCALHGLLYGTLYAPFQALAYHLSLKGMIAWIIAGLPYDAIHACGNLAAGVLVLPLTRLLRRLEAASGRGSV